MACKSLKIRLTGVSNLLCHNGQLADPLNEWSKKIKNVTSKRKKTDADYEEIARLEFYGGMYLDESNHPCIPGEVIEAVIISGAKKQKMGTQAKAGIYCIGNWKLQNGGADLSDLEKLWTSGKYHLTKGVSVGTATTMRTRPLFKLPWSVECEINYEDSLVNESHILQFLNAEGVAIGDWIPKFGRFVAAKT
jgi:hypothetical protein